MRFRPNVEHLDDRAAPSGIGLGDLLSSGLNTCPPRVPEFMALILVRQLRLKVRHHVPPGRLLPVVIEIQRLLLADVGLRTS
jgi:hypothetical protein